jgi:antitoxin CptB
VEDAERARLRWRCRRGMRELDVLLQRWLEREWSEADPGQRQVFERLLETEDDQLWAWVTGRERPWDAELAALVETLLDRSCG